jgi:hypothetical protein
MVGEMNKIIPVIAILVLIILVGSTYLGKIPGLVITSDTYQGCPIKMSATYALIPSYGYYSCEPRTYQYQTSSSSWYDTGERVMFLGLPTPTPYWQTNIGCPYDSTYTDKCTAYFKPKISITGEWSYRIRSEEHTSELQSLS